MKQKNGGWVHSLFFERFAAKDCSAPAWNSKLGQVVNNPPAILPRTRHRAGAGRPDTRRYSRTTRQCSPVLPGERLECVQRAEKGITRPAASGERTWMKVPWGRCIKQHSIESGLDIRQFDWGRARRCSLPTSILKERIPVKVLATFDASLARGGVRVEACAFVNAARGTGCRTDREGSG